MSMNIFNFVKEHTSIIDVVREYVTLKKVGSNWTCCCPFHHEKTASCMINEQKGIFYCFGCRIGGDSITFVSKIENCTPVQAAQLLADRYKITIPQEIFARQTSSSFDDEKSRYQTVGNAVARWCHQRLMRSGSPLLYIKDRGFEVSSLTSFLVGYFPGGLLSCKQLVADLKRENILADDLIKAGIMSVSKGTLFSPFEDRILFPIYDHVGHFCGFGGRTFKEHDQRSKYYNSKENDYFSKGTLLFGLDKAKRAIQEKDAVFLVEGYTDCIAMTQHGYANTVATLGTACTRSHLKQLSRYASRLIIIYDGDQAGQNAILRLTQLCWEVNLELFVASLPMGYDPASFLGQKNDMRPYILQAKEIFSFYIDSIGSQFESFTLSQKLKATDELLKRLKTVDNIVKQDLLLQRAAEALKIPFETLKKELSQMGVSQESLTALDPSEQEIAKEDSSASNLLLPLEKKIFCAIMNNIALFGAHNNHILKIIDYLPSLLSHILSLLQEYKEKGGELCFVAFFDTLDENAKQNVSRLLLEQDEVVDEKTFMLLLFQLQKKCWREMAHTFKLSLEKARKEGDENKVQKILHDFIALQQIMSSPLPHE